MSNSRPAVVLLSGGLDSATTLALAREAGFAPYALTFRYGQRHEREIEASKRVAAAIGVIRHIIVEIDLRQFGGSALTADIEVPKGRVEIETSREIPITYVPARNTVFLSYAVAWAETLASRDIFIGVNAIDYSGYPDCRPEFIAAFERAANLGTRVGQDEATKLHINAPLAQLSKAEIIRRGLELGVDYSLTTSCYDPTRDGAACGDCDACQLRLRGFAEVGIRDPIRYAVASASSS